MRLSQEQCLKDIRCQDYMGYKLIDQYNRKIDYMRISVTDRCNSRCRYCMPAEGLVTKKTHTDILSLEEIYEMVEVGVEMGITKVRITGGEPLVRKNIVELITNIGA